MSSIRCVLAALFFLVSSSNALYFYLEGTSPKCFYEELPKDTMVVGTYKAEAWNTHTNTFYTTNDLAMSVTVDETFDNDHRVVTQTSYSSETLSKFTFSAADSGLHRICFTPSGPAAQGGGWFSSQGPSGMGGIKVNLDMVIGESSKIESDDKDKVDNLVSRVRELHGRLTDIRKEQIYQREREAAFRDQSETTNGKIVRWTVIQMFVLAGTCAWQLSHLRSFFIKQKLT